MITRHSVLAMCFLWLIAAHHLRAQTKELIFIRHGESYMNEVYHSNPVNIIYRLTRDRAFLKDANINSNGIDQALRLHEALKEQANNEHSQLYSIANNILNPEESVMFLSSNLRRAANTGLIVRYGFVQPSQLSHPLHIVSALQERFLSRVFVDTIPHTKSGSHLERLFQDGVPEGLKVFEPIQEDLFSTYWNYCGSGIHDNPELCAGNYYGDARNMDVKVRDVLDLIFFEGSQNGIDLSKRKTIVIFGHSLWLQQMLEFLDADSEYRQPWRLIPNCGVFHMKIENQGTQYFLKHSKLYQS